MRTFFQGVREYSAHGQFEFQGTRSTAEELIEALRAIDKKFPWVDDEFKDSGSIRSIYTKTWSEGTGDTDIIITISPAVINLRQGQLKAYEKYLAKLTHELWHNRWNNNDHVQIWTERVKGRNLSLPPPKHGAERVR